MFGAAIVRKDLVRQAGVLLPACGLALAAVIGVGGYTMWETQNHYFEELPQTVVARWLIVAVLPLAWLVARQLVLREYLERGPDVWRALPVSRSRLFLLKTAAGAALLGLVVLGGVTVVGSLVDTLWPGLRRDGEEQGRQILWSALSLVGFGYAASLLWATCGRHRYLVATSLAGAAWLLEDLVSWRELPPLLQLEASLTRPELDLAGAAWAGGLLLLALVSWSARRGAWAQAWSGRWTEADSLRLLAAGALLAALATLRGGEVGVLRRLDGALVEQGPVAVRVPYPDAAQQSQELAQDLAQALADQAALTGLPAPRVEIEHRSGPAAAGPERLSDFSTPTQTGSSLLLQASFTDPDFAPGRLRRAVLREALRARPGDAPGSAGLWRDGLALWQALQEEGQDQDLNDLRRRTELRAAWAAHVLATDQRLDAAALNRDWALTRRRLGGSLAEALAAMVLDSASADDVRRLAPAALGPTAEPQAEQLAAQALGRLRTLAESPRTAALAPSLPALSGETGGGQLRLSASVRAEHEPSTILALLYVRRAAGAPPPLPGQAIDPVRRAEGFAAHGPLEQVVALTADEVVWATCAVWSPALGCEVISGWREWRP